jgi:hypothetical protein
MMMEQVQPPIKREHARSPSTVRPSLAVQNTLLSKIVGQNKFWLVKLADPENFLHVENLHILAYEGYVSSFLIGVYHSRGHSPVDASRGWLSLDCSRQASHGRLTAV